MAIPEILYHYCSNDSLHKIVTQKTILLTSASIANDYQESKVVLQYLNTKADDSQLSHKELYAELIDYIKNNMPTPPFIGCFTTQRDQLSQWRGYADDGRGVSIGFRTDNFEICERIPTINVEPGRCIGIHEIQYFSKQLEVIVDDILEHYLEKHVIDLNKHPEVLIETFKKLIKLSYISKNIGFHEENEWRIILLPFLHYLPGSHQLSGKDLPKVRSMVIRGNIATTFSLPLNWHGNTPPIAEIVIGPKNRVNRFDLDMLLKSNSMSDVNIEQSEISYC